MSDDKTLETLCRCRQMLLKKLQEQQNKANQDELESKREFENEVLNKLSLAKDNLCPVIEEIIKNASNLSVHDYKKLLLDENVAICSVTTSQFAGALEASRLLYEINQYLINPDKSSRAQNIRDKQWEFNTFAYNVNEASRSETLDNERITIDKELMRQLIELHELLGDTIARLKAGGASSRASSRKSCCGATKRTQQQPEPQVAQAKQAQKEAKKQRKLEKKLENQRKKELKRREKEAKKAAKGGGKKSKSATYMSYDATAPVNNIDDAKQKILQCLTELSTIQAFLDNSHQEIDMLGDLKIVGPLKGADCCERNDPHIHATLNGIPVVVQLNKNAVEELEKIMSQEQPDVMVPSESTDLEKCYCGPVPLDKCPVDCAGSGDLNFSHDKSKRPSCLSCYKKKSQSAVHHQPPSQSHHNGASSSILWKHPTLLQDMAETSLAEAHVVTTPQASITVFSTKKTKDGQKVRLSLTISPMNDRDGDSNRRDEHLHHQVVPEKDSSNVKKHMSYTTEESDHAVQHSTDGQSLGDYNVSEQKERTTLTNSKIFHPKGHVQRELQALGLDNLLNVCRPAKCCRKSVINEKPKSALPYPASLMSLPLDGEDVKRIKADAKRIATSKQNRVNYTYNQTFNVENYAKFQRNDNCPWVVRVYEVRFFQFFKTDRSADCSDERHSRSRHRHRYTDRREHRRSASTSRRQRERSNSRDKVDNEKASFLTWLPDLKFLDLLKKKQVATTSAQTRPNTIDVDSLFDTEIDETIIVPTKYQKRKREHSHRHRKRSVDTEEEEDEEADLETIDVRRRSKERQSRNGHNAKSHQGNRSHRKKEPGISSEIQTEEMPYKQPDFYCFQSPSIKAGLPHVQPLPCLNREAEDERDTSNDLNPGSTSSSAMALKTNMTSYPIAASKSLVNIADLLKYSQEKLLTLGGKDVVRIMPVQPCLVKMLKRRVDDASETTKTSVQTSVRVVSQDNKTQHLTKATSNNQERVKLINDYISLCKLDTFYPFKAREYTTYYNTIAQKLGAKNKNYIKSCTCGGRNSEKVNDLNAKNLMPCCCKTCPEKCATCTASTSTSRKLDDDFFPVRSTTPSTGSVDVGKRNKKTTIKCKAKHQSHNNNKLVGTDSNAFIRTHLESMRDERRFLVDRGTNYDSRPCISIKHVPILKEIGTSQIDFLQNTIRDTRSQLSFYFQCEDDDDELSSQATLPKEYPEEMSKKNHFSPDLVTRILKGKANSFINEQLTTMQDVRFSTKFHNFVMTQDKVNTDKIFENLNATPLPMTSEIIGKSFDDAFHKSRPTTDDETDSILTLQNDDCIVNGNRKRVKNNLRYPIPNKASMLRQTRNKVKNAEIERPTTAISRAASNCNIAQCASHNEMTSFTKLIDNLQSQIPKMAVSTESQAKEKSMRHNSTYAYSVDGMKKSGYISVLKPSCGCNEIAVFIPCNCDTDNSDEN